MAARTGDPVMGRFLQQLLLSWLQETGQSEAEFSRRAGLSKGAVNKIKNRAEGGGRPLVEGFARALGTTAIQLYVDRDRWHREQTGLPVVDLDVERAPRFGDLPEWPALEKAIRASRSGQRFGEDAWASARNTSGGRLPARLDEHAVRRLLELWQDIYDDADGAGAAEQAEVEATTMLAKAVNAPSPHPPTAKPKSGPRGK